MVTNRASHRPTNIMQTSRLISSANNPIECCSLTNAVRHGRCGSDPRMVAEFIRKYTVNSANVSREEQWNAQADIVRVLFETIAAPLLATCWRKWCMQCCCMPLHTLRCLSLTPSESENTSKLEAELRALNEYYIS